MKGQLQVHRVLFYLVSQSRNVIGPFKLHDSHRVEYGFGIHAGASICGNLPLFIAPSIALSIGFISREKPHSS